MEDGSCHVAREGQAAQLVVHDGDLRELVLGIGYAVGEPPHRLDEVVALADDPGAVHDVVARAAGHDDVAGGLGLAVDGQRGEGLVLGMHLLGAVEDVVGGHVDQGDAVLGAGAGEQRRPGRVGLPRGRAALGGLGPVHGGVGAEYRAVGDGDELVPGLRVDAAGDAAAVVVGDVVLDDAEVGNAESGHLGALPVLLEPAARVAVDGEVDDLEAPDAGLGDGEVLLECDVCHRSLPSYWPCAR